MRYAAFDIETAKVLPDSVDDLFAHAPLGIACAALVLSDRPDPIVWQGVPQLTRDECRSIVDYLERVKDDGYLIVSWNGCAFDFRVLAQESALFDRCGQLALQHVDMMAIVTFQKGYFLGLDKALQGAGLPGKRTEVQLSDGTILTDMSGKRAPSMWAAGEHAAVLEYLGDDVKQLLALINSVEHTKRIKWLSNRGNRQSVTVERLYTVRECFDLPVPDTSWMENPPARKDFVAWIPNWKKTAKARNGVGKPVSTKTPAANSVRPLDGASQNGRSTVRGCLYALAVFFVSTIALAIMASLVANDTLYGCLLLGSLALSVVAFFFFRHKGNTIRSLTRRGHDK